MKLINTTLKLVCVSFPPKVIGIFKNHLAGVLVVKRGYFGVNKIIAPMLIAGATG